MAYTAANREMRAEDQSTGMPEEKTPLPYNPQSGLATDFLNQYNELTMTLELVPEMPDLFSDFVSWRPKSYEQHFENSGFNQKDKIIAAYKNARPDQKNAFDTCVADLNKATLDVIKSIGQAIEAECCNDLLNELIQMSLADMRNQLGALSNIIHGAVSTSDQNRIDALLAQGDEPNSQDAIDALFD